MIAASEPLEFIPRGRQAVDEHPGSLTTKSNVVNVPAEHLLLSRLQNVNISADETLNEFWCVRELYDDLWTTNSTTEPINRSTANPNFITDVIVNSEEELYVKGCTAVWTKGITDENGILPRNCFTCESSIRHAFFCPLNFIQTEEPNKRHSPSASSARKNADDLNGICLIDSSSLKVYLSSGEDYLTSLEFLVSNVWITSLCILLEKDASCATINSQAISMPRLFSLAHPLDEMSPVLLKSSTGTLAYLTESDYKIIFSDPSMDLLLMYDNKIGKHFVVKLRKATEDEMNAVCVNETTVNSTNFFGHPSSFSQSQNTSLKHSGIGKPNTSSAGKSTLGTNITQSSLSQRLYNLSNSLHVIQNSENPLQNRSQIQSPLARLHSTMGTQNAFSILDMRKVGEAQPSKPIVPELCLEHIWTENMVGKEYFEAASSGFIHVDLINQVFLCYLLARTEKLHLARLEKSSSAEKPIFGMINTILAKDAVCLNKMKMIAVLAPCGTILLYSGPSLIGKLHVGGILSSMATLTNIVSCFRRSSLLSTVQSDATFDDELHLLSPVHPLQPCMQRSGFCCGLKDPAGNRVTLAYPGGNMYRISIPLISECPFVTRCLTALRQVLRKDLVVNLFAKWYGVRNAPGSQDLSSNKEWFIFKNVLLELLGRPKSYTDSQSQPYSSSTETKKRKRNDNIGCDSDWEFLQSFLNRSHGSDVEMSTQKNDSSAMLFSHIPVIFYALHLLYEDFKLNTTMKSYCFGLGEFLYQLAMDLQLDCYCLHYILDNPGLVYVKTKCVISETETKHLQNQHYFTGEVPSIFKFVYDVINSKNQYCYPFIKNVNILSKQVAQLTYLIVTGNNQNDCIKTIVTKSQVIKIETEVKPSRKPMPKVKRSKNLVYSFLDLGMTRQDIDRLPLSINYIFAESLEHVRISPPMGAGVKAYKLLLRPELMAHCAVDSSDFNVTYRNVKKEHSLSPRVTPIPDVIPKTDGYSGEDGMEHMDTKLFLLRFPNDLRVNEIRRLLSSSKPVPIDIVQSLGVSDHDFIEEQEKQLFFICTRTMSLPMGRGMFTLRTCTPTSTESLNIPKLCLTGRETLKGATIELQQIEVPPNMSMWPLFHNGVAAGLQITPDAKDIDSTWIVYNKPKGQSDGSTEHAGFLMALGLNGHLKSLSFTSIYEYLVKCDEMTGVGLLLGISVAHRGSMDITTTKLLSVHIEALLPATALELDIPQNIQVASLMGIGMIYQESAKRHIAEILLQEIGRPPGPEMENCVERESYAITAGLALGLVTLGQGETPTGLRDLQLPDTLHYYMIGGNKRPLTGSQKEKYKMPSFQVREGDTVNIDVTAPGATLALGLMFFGTGNKSVAHWMNPPNTSYLLDLVRPDLLLLRILAKGLIMWHEIEPTKEWILGHLPAALAYDLEHRPEQIDHEAICQAYCNIVTGAAMCVGLKYAGTENKTAFNTLKEMLDFFLNMGGQYIGEYAGKATVESCLILILLSLSLVYAGTGDVTILRICRMLKSRLGPSYSHVTYGSHMAIHMAIGFLFLGAGRFTLSRSPQAIAALVCALFPKFPTHSNDNRYHLQAFRHLYVLAVEPRIFLPRDIDSGKLCLCNIKYIDIKTDELRNLPMAPCILPELDSIKAVIVDDPNYWPVSFTKEQNWDQLVHVLAKCGCIEIKQKAGCLSHLDDPEHLKSLFAQTLTTEQYTCWKIEPRSLLSFSNHETVKNFISKFLFNGPSTSLSKVELDMMETITLQFYNCLTKDKMHGLPIYTNLIMILKNIEQNKSNTHDIWQFKILSTFLDKHRNNILLSSEILKSITFRLGTLMNEWQKENINVLKTYLRSSSTDFLQNCNLSKLQQIVDIVTYFDLPINALNLIDLNNEQISYIRLLLAFKSFGYDTKTVQCIYNLLKK